MSKLFKFLKYYGRFLFIMNILSWISGLTSNTKEVVNFENVKFY